MSETPCLSSDDLTSVISRCRSVLWLLASTKVEGRLYVSYLVPALPIQWVQMILNEHVRKWMNMAIYRTVSSASKPTPAVLQERSSGHSSLQTRHSLAISLHVLRNVAGNYQEAPRLASTAFSCCILLSCESQVMDTSAELFRECFQRFWTAWI